MNPVAVIATIKLNLCRRPLMHSSAAENCLDISSRTLNALIESGELPFAWNFSCGRARKEIRILAHCIVERSIGTIQSIGATRNLKLPDVVNLILPQTRESMRGAELQRMFHFSSSLIFDLHRHGEIKKVAERLPAVGPNASPRFTRASLIKLLEKRRVL
jgi:hypothetical protein